MLPDIVLAVCMHTALACSDIRVSVKDLNPRKGVAFGMVQQTTQAQAYMTNLGNLGIWFDEEVVEEGNEQYLLRLAVHETAHLMAFVNEDSYSGHGRKFTKYCERLANAVGVSPRLTCEAAGH
jgi:predicted SprT family Zn-dependent metalloprotease